MGTNKRERQKAGREARVAAAQEAQRKAKNRQRALLIGGVVAFVVVVVGVLAIVRSGDSSESVDTTLPITPTSTTLPSTTTVPAMSAAGMPCVPLADPLPAGAPDVPITPGPPPTELVIEDLVVGDGAEVPAGDPSVEVTVQYIGVSCSTGQIFDSSWGRGAEPATFPLGGVIDGWTQGIPGMKVGGQRLLIIPPDMGYGAQGSPPRIAPGETLYFVVDLEAIVTDPAAP